tara:strand:+ start:714 stop:1370 length:657 start_codon:yes stop_codon:yes gene_type:complete
MEMNSLLFNIVTPCTRPSNLFKIAASIKRNFNKDYWWHIVFDDKLFNKSSSVLFLDHIKRRLRAAFPVRKKAVNGLSFYQNLSSGKVGHGHRNYILDIIESKGGWIHFNDDDNILSSDFNGLQDALDPKYAAISLSQKNADGSLRFNGNIPLTAEPANMKTYRVDTAQLIYNLSYIKGQRFEEKHYEADGIFAEEFYRKHSNFLFLKNKFAYYNFLDV